MLAAVSIIIIDRLSLSWDTSQHVANRHITYISVQFFFTDVGWWAKCSNVWQRTHPRSESALGISVLSISEVGPKWQLITFLVHYCWPEPVDQIALIKGNKGLFVMHSESPCSSVVIGVSLVSCCWYHTAPLLVGLLWDKICAKIGFNWKWLKGMLNYVLFIFQ